MLSQLKHWEYAGKVRGAANDNFSTGKVNWQKRKKTRQGTLDCHKMLTCWMSILEVKESPEWQRAIHRGHLKLERWRDSQRHGEREREIWRGREAKWHSNGGNDRPKKEREFVGQARLGACKPTAEGLMMPGQTLSLFTKRHTAVFTTAGFLHYAGGHYSTTTVPRMQPQRRTCRACGVFYVYTVSVWWKDRSFVSIKANFQMENAHKYMMGMYPEFKWIVLFVCSGVVWGNHR